MNILKNLYFAFIELPKFNKNKEELSCLEEKGCYFFKHVHDGIEIELIAQSSALSTEQIESLKKYIF